MVRKMIRIDEDLCDGCGLCVTACHEGAIGLVEGKAKLLRDDYCDGLGNCLPVCPTGAIALEEREAAPFDEAAVRAAQTQNGPEPLPCGCPGGHAKHLFPTACAASAAPQTSQLGQWPVQMKLVPVNAPYFRSAYLLVAADCAAYAYGSFHSDFMRHKITLIGCPKLDDVDYSEKLTAILRSNDIKSLTVVRMDVPCCGGIEHAARTALKQSGRPIPCQVVVLTTDGQILAG